MAIASILAGIFSGMLSFLVGLIAGHGLVLALGLYVMGGLTGMVLMLAFVAIRARRNAVVQDVDLGLVPAQA